MLGRTLGETMEAVDSREFSEWQAYFQIAGEPHRTQPASAAPRWQPSAAMQSPAALDQYLQGAGHELIGG